MATRQGLARAAAYVGGGVAAGGAVGGISGGIVGYGASGWNGAWNGALAGAESGIWPGALYGGGAYLLGVGAPAEENEIPVGTNLTRNFGGESDLYGRSWTTEPANVQDRNGLGLETTNSAEFVAHGTVIDNTDLTTQEASRWGGVAGAAGNDGPIPSNPDST